MKCVLKKLTIEQKKNNMRFLRFIDRKFTFYDQKSYVISFLFFGAPIGYLFVQGIDVLVQGWEKYNFSAYNLLGNIITNLVILSPLIINYIRHTRKYNKIYKKIIENPNHKYKVKALYDYKNFIKDNVYDIEEEHIFMNFDKIGVLYIINNNNQYLPLKNIINKFELDDIKEDRLRKLKKLKKIWI